MSTRGSDRKRLLVDAAIEVIDTEGLRGLTHRSTEARAGLPPGTCSHHFPTRQALITAVLTRIAELERADIERFGPNQPLGDLDPAQLLEGATATLAHWLGPGRARSRARMLLMLDPTSRDLLAPTITTVAAGFREMAAEVTGDPELADLVVAFVEGLVLTELASDQTTVDIERLRTKMAAIVALARPDQTADPR